MTDDEGITFQATVAKVQTLADGAPRIAFDLPEYEVGKAALIMGLHRQNVEVTVKIVLESLSNGTTETDQRTAIPTADMVSR